MGERRNSFGSWRRAPPLLLEPGGVSEANSVRRRTDLEFAFARDSKPAASTSRLLARMNIMETILRFVRFYDMQACPVSGGLDVNEVA